MKLLDKKHRKKYIFFGVFVGCMLLLLTQTSIKELIQDFARQAWIFLAMLFIKFGEENFVRPMIVGEIVAEENRQETKSKLDTSKEEEE